MEMGQCGTEVTQFLVSTKSIIRSVPLILLLTVQDLLLSREYLCLNNRSCPIAKCWQFFPQRRAAVFLWLSNQRQSGVPHAPEADVLVFVARRAAHADRADYIAITIPEQNPTGKSGHPAPAYVDHAIHLAELGGVAVARVLVAEFSRRQAHDHAGICLRVRKFGNTHMDASVHSLLNENVGLFVYYIHCHGCKLIPVSCGRNEEECKNERTL